MSRPRSGPQRFATGRPQAPGPACYDQDLEVIGHYSNIPGLLPDLRRTLEAATTIVVEDDQPDVAANTPRPQVQNQRPAQPVPTWIN
jgi:hypothetical protein